MGDALTPAAGPRVTAVIVSWNSARYLPRCIEGILAQKLRPAELIGVDNASADRSAALLEAAGARVLRNETNRGFSAAVNQALAIATGEFLLLVNPDCRLDEAYAIRLAAALEREGDAFGAATGMLIRARGEAIEPTGEIDSLGIRMTRTGRHLDLGQGSPVASWPEQLASCSRLSSGGFEVFGVSGAAPLYRTRFLRETSVMGEALDEDFFAYREDADLAWRGRLFGWRALCVPEAVAWHVRRVSPEVRRSLPADVNMHSVKNRFLLRIKNEGIGLALRNAPFELARDAVVFGAALTIERTSLPAFSWLWRNRRRVLARRREIQRRRVISDRQLAGWFR